MAISVGLQGALVKIWDEGSHKCRDFAEVQAKLNMLKGPTYLFFFSLQLKLGFKLLRLAFEREHCPVTQGSLDPFPQAAGGRFSPLSREVAEAPGCSKPPPSLPPWRKGW